MGQTEITFFSNQTLFYQKKTHFFSIDFPFGILIPVKVEKSTLLCVDGSAQRSASRDFQLGAMPLLPPAAPTTPLSHQLRNNRSIRMCTQVNTSITTKKLTPKGRATRRVDDASATRRAALQRGSAWRSMPRTTLPAAERRSRRRRPEFEKSGVKSWWSELRGTTNLIEHRFARIDAMPSATGDRQMPNAAHRTVDKRILANDLQNVFLTSKEALETSKNQAHMNPTHG